MNALNDLIDPLGLPDSHAGGLPVVSPIDGRPMTSVQQTPAGGVSAAVDRAHAAFLRWRGVPGPARGELVRLFGQELRRHKDHLATLVTLECGKPIAEALGEVQEMIDVCDFAVGLSRQLHGLTIASERPGHHLRETWQPLGVVGIISAFNFPVAVWAWNAAIALVCGDTLVWKPSEKTPLTALACQHMFGQAAQQFQDERDIDARDVSSVVIGARDVGEALVDDPRVALVSATGSVPMGRAVAQLVSARLGRTLLELGGNNAMIVRPSADLNLAARAIVFAAVGTAGQRCTTLRRLIVHPSVKRELLDSVAGAYGSLRIGDPLDPENHVGPLIGRGAFDAMTTRIESVRAVGGRLVTGGGRLHADRWPDAYYVQPAIIDMPAHDDILNEECFAPVLHVVEADSLDDAIAMNNAVPQGLSSAIFTTDVREAEAFLSATGSDCGIANVNIGTSGAEIGGAFGGEKDTGGGRESGSDSWKTYMRRQTQTVNYSTSLPLAQGIRFEV